MAASAVPWVRVERDPTKYARVMNVAKRFGPVSNGYAVYRLLGDVAAREDQEVAWVVLLDIHGECRGVQEIARGARDHVGIDLPDALRAAQILGCKYLVLVHNHPTGYAVPSDDDAALTRDVEIASYQSGLLLLDHVVLGLGQFYSFRERALFAVEGGKVRRLAA